MNGMGDRIKSVRKSRNITQSAFSKELGISQAYVSKLEQDKENPSDLLLKFIAYRYCINLEWLKTGVGDMENKGGLGKEDSLNSLHMYTYELEKIFNKFADTQIYQITNSIWYFTSVIEKIGNSKNLKPEQTNEYINKLEEIYRYLWGINTTICSILNNEKIEDDIYLRINSTIIEIQKILVSLCSLQK